MIVRLFCFYMLLVSRAFAQGSDSLPIQFTPELRSGVLMGLEISDGRGIYKSGGYAHLAGDFRITNKVHYRFGAGLEKLRDETFIPIMIGFAGMLQKDNNTPYISIDAGYAFGFNDKVKSFRNYQYNGGLFFSPGINYKLSVRNKFSVVMNATLKHQFASVEYMIGNTHYTEDLNFNFMMLGAGIYFR